MKDILHHLFQYKTLTRQKAKSVLVNIASAKYNYSQVAAFMSVYLMRSITLEELSGFREAMLELCLNISFDHPDCIDIVGTGGDKKNTFNISTLSCFVVAGSGIKVCKHGNYGVSSVSGSSNVMEAIGYKFVSNKDVLQKQLDEAGLCFLHAPLFHPAMKNIGPIRKELGVRTFFNLLGPLINPASPKHKLLGVFDHYTARLYNYLLQNTSEKYAIIYSEDGYDEISLTGGFKIISNKKEQIIDPEKLGMKKLNAQSLHGGYSIEEAAKIFMNVLEGKGEKAQNDVVIANAAVAIHQVKNDFKNSNISTNTISLIDCISEARESLESGKALSVYKKVVSI